jgi:cytochrome oxidase Cu insertion factor (SCO1/SenC/PrrC family)
VSIDLLPVRGLAHVAADAAWAQAGAGAKGRVIPYNGRVVKDRNGNIHMALPEIGSVPPAFSLTNQDGKTVSLAGFAGKQVLVWFFPRAFGGG